MEHIELFDGPKSVQDVLDAGVQSELLRGNAAFNGAVKRVYWKLTQMEDALVTDLSSNRDNREINEKIKRISNMRALLVDIVLELDGDILEANNVKLQQEEI